MPLRNDLLSPISADSPTGKNLRYDPLYDKIKEARREDLDIAQGEWKRERKLADWPLTIKLTSEALASKTKDLQLAVWLTQALLRREGISSFQQGVDLIRQLMEIYWDGIYPEIEDGDLELRVGPLEWLASESDREPDRPTTALKLVPITRGGLSWVQFDETRQVGTEDAADSYEKQQARARKIEEGKTPPEVFDKDFDETPKAFYADLEKVFDLTMESVRELSRVCDEKFGDVSPSFGPLQKVLEEVRQTVHVLLVRKREKDPDPVVASEAEEAAPAGGAETAATAAARSVSASPFGRASASLTPMAPLPGSWEDAVSRVVAAAKFMRQQDPSSPAPYLMLRGLRWGELRGSGAGIDPGKLAAPLPEIRHELKRAQLDSAWAEVLETAEMAMGMECGRGWLDLQRYAARACQELGGYYEPVRRAIIAELAGLLATYPQLPDLMMMDDLPTASAETQAWIKKQVLSRSVSLEEAGLPPTGSGIPVPQRAIELAMQAASAGRPEVSLELLMREIAQEPSGRGKFQRRIQLARVCHANGNSALALQLLQEATNEIDNRKLEEWESREMLASPLGLFYQCLVKTDGSSDERDRVYAWICRLDPFEAMKLER